MGAMYMSLGRTGSTTMLPGPKPPPSPRSAAGIPPGVTLIQTPGGHVPASTHGSGPPSSDAGLAETPPPVPAALEEQPQSSAHAAMRLRPGIPTRRAIHVPP